MSFFDSLFMADATAAGKNMTTMKTVNLLSMRSRPRLSEKYLIGTLVV